MAAGTDLAGGGSGGSVSVFFFFSKAPQSAGRRI